MANEANEKVKELCLVWLDFLNHAGKYAQRYYLARDLELPPWQQDPKSNQVMLKTYKDQRGLDGTIQRDLDTFPGELLAIRDAQVACGLPPFSDREGYLGIIADGFANLEKHGKRRREYYRTQIKAMLRKIDEGKDVKALSLNQLEAKFQEYLPKSEARRAKKAAKN